MPELISGVLEKRSSSWFYRKRWYKRLFSLTEDELSYSDPQKPKKFKKSFALSKVVIIKPSCKHYLEFEVFFADRRLRLRAASHQEKLEWLSALRPKQRFSERLPIPLAENSVRLEDFVAGLERSNSEFRHL